MSFFTIIPIFIVISIIGVQYLNKFIIDECRRFDVGDSNGKIVVVTGANSGLGFYTALYLANHGSKVIMGCRSAERCSAAKAKIMRENSSAVEPDVIRLDLGSFLSIYSFVREFKSKYKSFDVLVNNAGVMALMPRQVTEDGIESQFGINHIGHFLLTSQLYPLLNKGGRIVNHASSAHAFVKDDFIFHDYQTTENYSALTSWSAYGKSKTANLQFTYELNDRLNDIGNPNQISVIAVHPGYTSTELQSKSSAASSLFGLANKYIAMDVRDGSLSQLAAALLPELTSSNNTFYGPKYEVWGAPVVTRTGKYNKKAQVRLWEVSEELTKIKFYV